MTSWQSLNVRVIPGYKVASGLNSDPRFPGGTLRMQAPFFRKLGFELDNYHGGTINVSLAPHVYRVLQAPITFRQVKWHPTEPAEDFSFFDVRLVRPGGSIVEAKVYYPHPETKPEHFQQPDTLELLFPYLEGITVNE